MDDWDEFEDFIAAPPSKNVPTGNKQERDNVSSRPTSSSSIAKGKRRTEGGSDNRPKTSSKEKDSSEDWADDETSWNGRASSKPVASRPSSSSSKSLSVSAGSRPKTSAEVKDPSAEWGDDEADVRPRSSGNKASGRPVKSPIPSATKPQENGWLDESMSQSTVDILREADEWLADDPGPSRSGSAADRKGPGSSAAGSRAELKSRHGSRAGK
ncbi:uncharacterized protein [Branchiostoma lanceolatum]|uniref:uncharacterized protein n=1 Tax=Branchiostoma lanceolatum TaxID=7740 RepID=UPI00345462E3